MSVKDKFKEYNTWHKYEILSILVEEADKIGEAVLNKEEIYEKLEEYREMQKYVRKKYGIPSEICENLIHVALLKAHDNHDEKIKGLERKLNNHKKSRKNN